MPVMAIYERQDVSSELYNQYRELVPLDAAPPGALVHAYAREGSGFVTVDLWETRASLDRFIAQRVKPACRTLGVEFVAPGFSRSRPSARRPARPCRSTCCRSRSWRRPRVWRHPLRS